MKVKTNVNLVIFHLNMSHVTTNLPTVIADCTIIDPFVFICEAIDEVLWPVLPLKREAIEEP